MFIPSFSHIVPVIEIRHVGLYIQQRRAIKDVDFADGQDIAFDVIQPYDRNPNWIWPIEMPY